MEHELHGEFPTEVTKTITLSEDGEIEESVTGENHRPGHLSGNHVECSCGEEWEGVNVEKKAKQHLKQVNATDLIYERYKDVEHRGWTLHMDGHVRSLYWMHEDLGIPLSIYATPFWEGENGITVHVHNVGGEELVTRTVAESKDPEQVIENYVEIITGYIDRNWMGENQ